jgi:hypothetical protein
MPREKRIRGGAQNSKSGQKWNRQELESILELYTQNNDLKIHESNELIQSLARELGRTTRSVEAQLLMFRNLSKFGYYGYGNMNKLCKELWKEYIDKII